MLNSNYLHKIIIESISDLLFQVEKKNSKKRPRRHRSRTEKNAKENMSQGGNYSQRHSRANMFRVIGKIYCFKTGNYQGWFKKYCNTKEEAEECFKQKRIEMSKKSTDERPLLRKILNNGGVCFIDYNNYSIYIMNIINPNENLNLNGEEIYNDVHDNNNNLRRADFKRERIPNEIQLTQEELEKIRSVIERYRELHQKIAAKRGEVRDFGEPKPQEPQAQDFEFNDLDDALNFEKTVKKKRKRISYPDVRGNWDSFQNTPKNLQRVSFPLKPKR